MAGDRRLFFLLHRAHRALFAHVNARTYEALGVSSAQLAALYYLAKHDGCSPSEIADMLDLNKSAVSAMVRRMERAGVVRRAANPRDRRATRLHVTAKGRAVHAQSLPLIRRLTSEALAGLDERQVDTVFRFLNAIVARYGDAGEPARAADHAPNMRRGSK